MNTQNLTGVGFASTQHLAYGTDAAILVGASCGGEADYRLIAEELGYGSLAMPYPCDAQTIEMQLERVCSKGRAGCTPSDVFRSEVPPSRAQQIG